MKRGTSPVRRGGLHALTLLTLAALAGCAALPTGDPQPRTVLPPIDPPARAVVVPGPEPGTEVVIGAARGNPPFYDVFGQRYFVLPTSAGYREQGVASWYGPDFHGKLTSTGEVYDMYQLTAAHPTLPLPTMVRVTNLTNGLSVEVLVNDRGPFARNRIIDLSYSAAKAIDMIGPGTAPVEVEALNVVYRSAADAGISESQVRVAAATVIPDREMFIQVGAYTQRENAQLMKQRVRNNGLGAARLQHDRQRGLYLVHVGPIVDAAEYDLMLERMRALGILETQLVTVPVR
ncbi:MAG: septal ring lytic transglycosylase RlpA family protein [Chromatiales bacterium]|nr:septal ring lytic transglycosylase RlpA family protein [Chromatiales bacterium]